MAGIDPPATSKTILPVVLAYTKRTKLSVGNYPESETINTELYCWKWGSFIVALRLCFRLLG